MRITDELSEVVEIKDLHGVQFDGVYEIPMERNYSIAFVTVSEFNGNIAYVTEITQGKGTVSHNQYEINHIPGHWKLLSGERNQFNFFIHLHKELKEKISSAIQKNKRIVILPGQTSGKTFLTRNLRELGYDALELFEAIEQKIQLTSHDVFINLDEFFDVKEGKHEER